MKENSNVKCYLGNIICRGVAMVREPSEKGPYI